MNSVVEMINQRRSYSIFGRNIKAQTFPSFMSWLEENEDSLNPSSSCQQKQEVLGRDAVRRGNHQNQCHLHVNASSQQCHRTYQPPIYQ